MTSTFRCASCSAPLEFEGTTIQKCRYCGCTVIAPSELFSGAPSIGDLSSLTGKALRIAEINQHIHDGNKIEAIKLFRQTFGVGLAEAKEAVERMARGESVDISGIRVGSRSRASAADIEKVKKIGYTVGGSILLTILASLLIIGGVTASILYFTWRAIDKIPVVANSANARPTAEPLPTPTPDMVELLKLGGEGNGAGRFKDNRHVAVDGKGRIYSSDYSPIRIQVFDADGKFLNQWAAEAGTNLYDLVADRDGSVYLANDKGIFKHDGETGKLLAKSVNVYPRGLALTWDGKLAVTAGKPILIMDASLNILSEFKDAAERANSVAGFEKITADGSGLLYALDRRSEEICKFSADGKFLNRFQTGANSPHALAIDPQGRLFVSDTSRILVLDTNGQQIRSLSSYQAFGLTFNQSGELFIAARPYILKNKLNF